MHVAVFQFLDANGIVQTVLGATLGRFVDDGIGFLVALVTNYFINVNYTWRRRASI